jgi:dephospho-CoA kinase
MLKVGLTGGVACGKTTVGKMFVARGARLVQADEIARQLMQPGQPVYRQVVEHFGSGILQPDGSIDRRALADAAFTGGRIEELNRIVHPAVVAYQDRWMEEAGARYQGTVVIVEAALILEAGVRDHFDQLVVVTCKPEQRVARYAARQHSSPEEARREVERRSAAQFPDEEKIRAADYVIDNSGALALTERQVDTVFADLKKLAAEKRR